MNYSYVNAPCMEQVSKTIKWLCSIFSTHDTLFAGHYLRDILVIEI